MRSSETLGMLLVSTGKQIADQIKPAFDAEDLRWRHVEVMRLVAGGGSTTQQHLIEAMAVDPSVLVGLLNELETADVVQRIRDRHDRRRHLVELTAHGAQVLARVLSGIADVEQTALTGLTMEEQHTLRRLLALVRGQSATSPSTSACERTDDTAPC